MPRTLVDRAVGRAPGIEGGLRVTQRVDRWRTNDLATASGLIVLDGTERRLS